MIRAKQSILCRLSSGEELVCVRNKIVTSGLGVLAAATADQPYAPTHLALGTGTTAVADGDVALETEKYRAELTRRVISSTFCELELYVPKAEANGWTYTEAGLLVVGRRPSSVGEAATLFNRVNISPGIVKDSSVELAVIWQITYQDATP